MKVIGKVIILLMLLALVIYVVGSREIHSFGGESLIFALYLCWFIYSFKGDEE